ncbi:hypothetical protein SAMN04487995_0879 [Dyadobacter koreensis]|uniref:Uncharacterized protein n=1 Tax=Dyadobacter koreensis TaxID=408657 RepID=A0A1H6R1M3_9BACT|nr:hypothetical protein SAMN04487995_0879 [Dyadobacter koreensis]
MMTEINPILPNIGKKGKLTANSITFMSIILISLGLGLIKRNISGFEILVFATNRYTALC